MAVGRVIAVNKSRLGCSVSTTVVGDNVTTLIPVDAAVVDFDEAGGSFLHQPTGDVYAYTSADIDAETITLTAGLPSGKTLTLDDALYVYPRADDFYADVSVDDVGTDVVSARVPVALRAILAEGHGNAQVVRIAAGGEEWHVTELVGQEPEAETGSFETGDIKQTARVVSGSGALIDGGWLKCDGTAVSRSTYAALFNAIGTTFGNGNGSTTFNIPDARSRALFGTGTLVVLGENEGKTETNRGPSHKHSISNQANHQHNIPSVSHSGASNAPGTGALDKVATLAGTTGGSHDHSGSTGSTGGHDHGGDTGTAGSGSSDPFSYIGFNVLIKT